MKLLVTGGAGFIGSNFIRYTLQEHANWQVVNLDKLTYAGNLENLKDIEGNARYRFVKGDIADGELVSHLLKQEFDVIVNFAAESHVDRSILDCSPFIETNVIGTQVLLEAERQHKIKKSIQVSTDEVYGHDRRYSPETNKIRTGLGWKPSVSFAEGLGKTIEW